MSASEKIDQLLNKIRDNNNELIGQLRTMNEGDQVYYSKKITEIMERTSKTVGNFKKAELTAPLKTNKIKKQSYGN